MPDFLLEHDLMTRGASQVAGVDEVGRGPLAGPVVAAAVILDPCRIPDGLADSKTLSAARREALAAELHRTARTAIGVASVAEIDEINILRASHVAMNRALAGLDVRPCHALIDGNMIPRDIACPASAIVKGDAKSVSIAAASIVAKVWRDNLMVDLAQHHPGYGWEKNAGYATKTHREALLELGITPHHRRSFRTVHNIL